MPSLLHRAAARVIAALFCLGACAARAQDASSVELPELGDRFARVSIREHEGTDPVPAMLFDIYGEWFVRGASLHAIIASAYGVAPFRIVDGPEWIHATNLYDIDAVPPPAELVKSDNMAMVRNLLTERFDLELRASTRDMTVLALEFVQETPALQWTETPEMLRLAPGQRLGIAWRRAGIPSVRQAMSVHAELTLETLADQLSRELQRPVVDGTNLEGVYTMHLDKVIVGGLPFAFEFSPLLERLGLRVVERTLMLDVLEVVNIAHPQLDEAAQGALEHPAVNDR